MMRSHRVLVVVASAFAAWVYHAGAVAANAEVVLNVEGSPSCGSLSPKDLIDGITIERPSSGSIDGPGGQLIDYAVDGHNEVTWQSTVPVNYVILNARGAAEGGTVYHYGVATGANGDDGLILFPNAQHQGDFIQGLRFCYGLGTPPTLPPPVVRNAGDCAELAQRGGIDGTIVQQCPHAEPGKAGDERILLSFNPNNPNLGMVFCTCNLNDQQNIDGVFEQCDPEAEQVAGEPAGGDPKLPPAPGDACSNGKSFVKRVPINITGVEDPDSFLCFAIGGKRSCFYHFPDK